LDILSHADEILGDDTGPLHNNPSTLLADPELQTRPRVMQVIPRGLKALWVKLCEKHFARLIQADTADDHHARIQALRDILSNVRMALQIPADRSTQPYTQWLKSMRRELRKEIAELMGSAPSGRALSLSIAPPPTPTNNQQAANASPASAAIDADNTLTQQRELRAKADRRIKRAQSKINQGYVSKAFAALTSNGVHDFSAESVAAMRSLHPAKRLGEMPPMPPSTPRIAIDLEKLKEVIRHIDNGSSPGISGWSGAHAAQLIANDTCLRGIGVIVRLMLNREEAALALRNLLLAVPLADLRKGSNGKGHRPVTLGEIFYRITARYALTLTPESVIQSLFPAMQYGAVGQSSGQERALHLMRTARAMQPRGVTISIDSMNAFNTLYRTHIAKVLYSHPQLSHLWAIFDFAYGESSALIMYQRGEARAVLDSAEGVKQGDALGSFLFCLAIQPALQAASQASRLRCIIIAFVDDINVVGPLTNALTAFDSLRFQLGRIGLQLALPKCSALFNCAALEVSAADRARVRQAGIAITNEIVALGCCISEDGALIHKWAEGLLAEAETQAEQLLHPSMRVQHAMLLLRMSLAARMDYIMRVLPPEYSLPLLRGFDALLLRTFLRIAQIEAPADAVEHTRLVQRIQLPVSMGGLGIASKAAIAPIAWFASLVTAVTDVLSLCKGDIGVARRTRLHAEIVAAELEITATNPQYHLNLPDAMASSDDGPRRPSIWAAAAARLRNQRAERRAVAAPAAAAAPESIHQLPASHPATAGALVPPHLQRLLSAQYHRLCRERLLRRLHSDGRHSERASLLSASQRNSALWLTAMPRDTRFRLRDEEMIQALRLRLHLPPRDLSRLRATNCPCGAGDLERDPLHYHSCKLLKRGAITTRHDLVLHTLSAIAEELGVPRTIEPRPAFVVGDEGDLDGPERQRQRPDLMLITTNHSVAELLTDITIVNPAAESCLTLGAAQRALSAVKTRETRKESKYGHLVRDLRPGVREMKAFGMEVFGAFGPHADYVVKAVLKHAYRDDCDGHLPPLLEARTRLSIALQRGNARVALKGIEVLCGAHARP
jgi:hypothetical protein